jgi:hypothetical protein
VRGWCAYYATVSTRDAFARMDLPEVDHIVPTSMCAKDGYISWQLLHRHCHDEKTALELHGVSGLVHLDRNIANGRPTAGQRKSRR